MKTGPLEYYLHIFGSLWFARRWTTSGIYHLIVHPRENKWKQRWRSTSGFIGLYWGALGLVWWNRSAHRWTYWTPMNIPQGKTKIISRPCWAFWPLMKYLKYLDCSPLIHQRYQRRSHNKKMRIPSFFYVLIAECGHRGDKHGHTTINETDSKTLSHQPRWDQ